MSNFKEQKASTDDQKSALVIQHNHLIEAKYHLTLQEKRLMCWLASQVKQTDEDFKEHALSIKEFAGLVGVKGDHLYKTLDTMTHKLMQKIITIRSLGKKGFTKAALLGGVKYCEGQGIIKLSFHPYLKPYMLQLKECFTKISLGDVIGLRSIHAIRIYELLKQYESLGTREITLIDLRDYCGIKENQYKKFNNLKKDVIEIAKREINDKADLFIKYEEIKESRKIVSIKFYISKNNQSGQTNIEKSQIEKAAIIQKELRSGNAIIQQLLEYGFTTPHSKRIVKSNDHETLVNAIKSVDIQVERGKAKNPKAMIVKAIQEKWHPEKFVDRKRKTS